MGIGGGGPLDESNLKSSAVRVTTLVFSTFPCFPKSLGPHRNVKQPGKALDTPLKFNMEPENTPLEKEIPFGNHHFQVPC